MFVALCLFGLALTDRGLDAVQSGIVDINRRFVLLADLLVDEVAVFLEGKTLVIIYGDFDFVLSRNEFFLVVEIYEIRVGKNLFN